MNQDNHRVRVDHSSAWGCKVRHARATGSSNPDYAKGRALMADAVEFMPSAERIDGRSIRLVLDDYVTAHRAFIASV